MSRVRSPGERRTFPKWGQFLFHGRETIFWFITSRLLSVSRLGWLPNQAAKTNIWALGKLQGGSCRLVLSMFSRNHFQIVPEQALHSQSIPAQYLWITVNWRPVIQYLNFTLASVNTPLVDKIQDKPWSWTKVNRSFISGVFISWDCIWLWMQKFKIEVV